MSWKVVGTPLRTVARSRSTASSASPGSNRSCSSTVPPFSSIGRQPIPSDATWNSGDTMSARSLLSRS